MDQESNSIDLLKEFARRSNRKVEYSEKIYPNTSRVIFYRRTLYIPNSDSGNTFFVSYQDTKEFGKYRIFSGAFIDLNEPNSFEANLRRKDIIDKLNPRIKKLSLQTGSRFDSRFVIYGNNSARVRKIFNNHKVQELIKRVFEIEDVMYAGINNVDLDFIPGLKGKSNFGIFSNQKWIVEPDTIEKLFLMVEAFKRSL